MKRQLLTATLVALAALNLEPLPATAARVRCADFATQQEAQAYMQQHGTTYLDGDKDGVACESCPSWCGSTRVPTVARPQQPSQASLTAAVISVGDGDTLRVQSQGKAMTVRLACVDAAEMKQAPYGRQHRNDSSNCYRKGSRSRYGSSRSIATSAQSRRFTSAVLRINSRWFGGQAVVYDSI
jgi:endonuclease YncB( thermonuclease family)